MDPQQHQLVGQSCNAAPTKQGYYTLCTKKKFDKKATGDGYISISSRPGVLNIGVSIKKQSKNQKTIRITTETLLEKKIKKQKKIVSTDVYDDQYHCCHHQQQQSIILSRSIDIEVYVYVISCVFVVFLCVFIVIFITGAV